MRPPGLRLASPSEFIHAKDVGIDQLALFLVTLIVTLATDLLIGVGVGLLLLFVLHVLRGVSLRDHTFLTRLKAMAQEWPEARLSYEGLDTSRTASRRPLATRIRSRT